MKIDSPISFTFGPLTIYWYGILVALGFVAGLWTASRRGTRDGLRPEQIFDAMPWLLVGTIVGARILYVITFWKDEFASKPFIEMFMVQKGGLVFYGGFIGATLGAVLYTLKNKIQLWKFADALAPSIALGHMFGRLGCLMTGCCYGKECNLPWAIHFPENHQTHGAGVHPTQIYEAVLNLLLYFLLAWLYRRKKFNGQIFAFYLLCYAIVRSFVESFRADYRPEDYYVNGLLSPGQLVSVGIFAAGLLLLWKLPRSKQGAPKPIKETEVQK